MGILKDDFRKIEIEDRGWINELLSYSDYNATDYNFTVMYIWRDIIHTNVARYKDILLIRYADTKHEETILSYTPEQSLNLENNQTTEKTFNYLFPVGKGALGSINQTDNQLLEEAVELIFTDAKSHNASPAFICALQDQKLWIENFINRRKSQGATTLSLSIFPMRNSYDYLYCGESLLTLKGKKYQSKRNFVNGFKRDNEWSFEPINENNIEECIEMNKEWCKLNGCMKNSSLTAEQCSVKNALNNFFSLKLYGGLLRVKEKVVAFTIGEKMNSNTILVHIEKAFSTIRGAYQTISYEFLNYLNTTLMQEAGECKENIGLAFEIINREDDAGDLGLRRAKQEYHPIGMVEKFYIKILSNEPD